MAIGVLFLRLFYPTLIHLKLLLMLSGINGKTGEPVVQLLDLVAKQEVMSVPHLAVQRRTIVQAFARMDLSLSY